jgi:hypothetical protein
MTYKTEDERRQGILASRQKYKSANRERISRFALDWYYERKLAIQGGPRTVHQQMYLDSKLAAQATVVNPV